MDLLVELIWIKYDKSFFSMEIKKVNTSNGVYLFYCLVLTTL